MPGTSKDRRSWVRLSGMGFEFGAAVIGFVLVGYWIDRHYGCRPTGVLIGAALGILGGGYNLIRTALRVSRQVDRDERENSGDRHG